MTQNFCIDCTWYLTRKNTYNSGQCEHPKNLRSSINLETGEKIIFHRYLYSHTHRSDGWLQCRLSRTCGEEGRWFEPGFNKYYSEEPK